MAEAGAPNEEEPPSDQYDVSIKALSKKTKNIISTLLNPYKILPTEKGLSRDWQGLLELLIIPSCFIPQIKDLTDPTERVLQIWVEKEVSHSTIRKLLDYLEQLDRFDVIDDINEFLDTDIKQYNERLATGGVVDVASLDNDKHILTVDDVHRINQGLAPQIYDAFVLFADDDIGFATELIETMEKQRNLKFCVKDRDLVGGAFEHEVIIRLISERCNRLIVIISQSFLSSAANKFFVSFAQAIGIEQRKRKIIPCLISQCELPLYLRCYFMLDYHRNTKLWNFWDKLYDSIRTTDTPQKQLLNRSVSQQVRPNPNLKSVQNSNSLTLKPKKDSCVSFTSLNSKESIAGISPSSSMSTVTSEHKKSKLIKWIKKVLPESHVKQPSENLGEKKKKRFWQKHSKQKLAEVAN